MKPRVPESDYPTIDEDISDMRERLHELPREDNRGTEDPEVIPEVDLDAPPHARVGGLYDIEQEGVQGDTSSEAVAWGDPGRHASATPPEEAAVRVEDEPPGAEPDLRPGYGPTPG
ncbi:MAG TPA: hypothetical protein VGP70_20285 [Actinomadura sp.]|jgi:hypothetical protein|nr:hypothetical protein [Actinomadura sp.]